MAFGEKILEKAVDIALVAIFFNMEALSRKRRDWKNLDVYTGEDLEEFNYETIKRSISFLREKGFIQAGREKFTLPKITEEGQKRLTSILPEYDANRVWDNRVYLITYDLPVNKNRERNSLRLFLKKIGCGMLQKSVWITPYNPAKLAGQFVKEKGLTDLILVSSLGKDGTIGNLDLIELFTKIYGLQKLNKEYVNFISNTLTNKLTKDQLIFQFLNTLGRDPQLPFSLLPQWWKGDIAFKIFQKFTK